MILRLTAIIIFALSLDAGLSSSKDVNAQGLELVLRTPPFIQKGRALIQEGKAEEAQDIYREALKRDLTDHQTAEAHNGLCVAYIMDETWESALNHCNQAIKIRPNNWRYYNNRGNVFYETGSYDRAIEEYERGLKMAPNSRIMQGNLELALNQKRQFDTSKNTDDSSPTRNI